MASNFSISGSTIVTYGIHKGKTFEDVCENREDYVKFIALHKYTSGNFRELVQYYKSPKLIILDEPQACSDELNQLITRETAYKQSIIKSLNTKNGRVMKTYSNIIALMAFLPETIRQVIWADVRIERKEYQRIQFDRESLRFSVMYLGRNPETKSCDRCHKITICKKYNWRYSTSSGLCDKCAILYKYETCNLGKYYNYWPFSVMYDTHPYESKIYIAKYPNSDYAYYAKLRKDDNLKFVNTAYYAHERIQQEKECLFDQY